MTRDDVVDRLANGVLLQSAELRNIAKVLERTAESLGTATEALLAVKREIHDGNAEDAEIMRGINHNLGSVNERLAVISKDVDDVERVTREATGAHALSVAHEGNAGLVRAFGELPPRAQWIAGGVILVLPFAGAFGHWLISALTK